MQTKIYFLIFFLFLFWTYCLYWPFKKQKKIIGKTPGKDIKQMKSTILKYFNNSDINIYCKKIVDKFIMKNSLYFKKWPDLKKLLFYLINQLS